MVVPTFRGAQWLGEALGSVAEAVGDEEDRIEILVVDDRSDDATLEVARTFESRLPLRIFERESPRSWVLGTNEGLAAARGRYCCFLHQDDRWLPDRWRLLRRHLESEPAPDLLLTAACFIDARGRAVGPWRCPLPAGAVEPALLHERLVVQNFIAIPAPVVRTELLDQVGRSLDPSLWYTADWDLWLRLARGDARIVYEPAATVAFRIHPDSQTVARSLDGDRFRYQLEEVLQRHLSPALPRSARAAARLSLEINLALAALAHRRMPALGKGLRSALLAVPAGWWRLLRDARLEERVPARLRALSR